MELNFSTTVSRNPKLLYSRYLELRNEIVLNKSKLNNISWFIAQYNKKDTLPLIAVVIDHLYREDGVIINLDTFKELREFSKYNFLPFNRAISVQIELLFLSLHGYLGSNVSYLLPGFGERELIMNFFEKIDYFFQNSSLNFITHDDFFYRRARSQDSNTITYVANIDKLYSEGKDKELALKRYNPFSGEKGFTILNRIPCNLHEISNFYGYYITLDEINGYFNKLIFKKIKYRAKNFNYDHLLNNSKKIYITDSSTLVNDVVAPLSMELKIKNFENQNLGNFINYFSNESGVIYKFDKYDAFSALHFISYIKGGENVIFIYNDNVVAFGENILSFPKEFIPGLSRLGVNNLKSKSGVSVIGESELFDNKNSCIARSGLKNIFPYERTSIKKGYKYDFFDRISSEVDERVEKIYRDIHQYLKNSADDILNAKLGKKLYTGRELKELEIWVKSTYSLDIELNSLLNGGYVSQDKLYNYIRLRYLLKINSVKAGRALKGYIFDHETRTLSTIDSTLTDKPVLDEEILMELYISMRDKNTVKIFSYLFN